MQIRVLAAAGGYVRRLEGWPAIASAFLSGVLGALAFAPLDLFPLLLVSLGLLVVLLDGAHEQGKSLGRLGLLGWAWGFGQFLTGLYWVAYAFMVDPAVHGWQMPFAVVLLTSGLALFPGLAVLASAMFWSEGPGRYFVLAACLGASEWLRGHVFTGFPWNLAAYGWGASLAVLQSVAVIGAYGLTLLTILLGTILAELFATAPRWRLVVASLVIALGIWGAGALRLALDWPGHVAGVTLRIVQPDIPQAEKYRREFVERNWLRLLGLSTRPAKTPINLLIWPEAAPSFLLQREPAALDEIATLTRSGETLVTGGERVDFRDGLKFFNSVFIFAGNGRLAGVYDKSHLVPFGEYVPFADLLNRVGITKLTHGDAGFSAGEGPRTFEIPGVPSLDPLICYEILFPGAVTGTPRPGFIVNVTDDSWFGPASGPHQHLLVARVRAIEEGLPVVRAANTGISAIIDPLGRTKAILRLDEMGTLDGQLPAALAPTPYVRFGDAGFWLLLAAAGLAGALWRRN
ncbi:MAG: apolipoprotein N-acyltransferase [Alphaproteobacteria bacterium]|nr:apolipoprotein N-acyltransferase [Alphaproteobacteria bacterium]